VTVIYFIGPTHNLPEAVSFERRHDNQNNTFFLIYSPAYIAESLQLSFTIEGRRLRSTDAIDVFVPVTCCRTLGDRSFPVAAVRAWDTLQSSVRLSSSLNVFCRCLKTELFRLSYPVQLFFLFVTVL